MPSSKSLSADTAGGRLRAIRDALGLKQKDFADSLEISVPTLSEIENGKTPPGYNVLINASRKHNVNVNYVLLGEGEAFRSEKEEEKDPLAERLDSSPYSARLKDLLRFMVTSDYAALQVLLMYERLKLSDDPLIQNEFEELNKKLERKMHH